MLTRTLHTILFTLLLSLSLAAQTKVDSTLAKYDRYWELKEGMYRVSLNGKMGVVNNEGVIIVPCDFNQIWNLDEKGFFRVLKNGKAGVYHKDGKVIIPAEYDQIWPFNNGWAKVMRHGKLGYFNRDGLSVVPCEYQQIWPFEDGRARILKNGKVGYIDTTGVEIIPATYQQIWSFEDGRARVLKDGKVGYINDQGDIIIPAVYSHIWAFEEGKAKALLDGQMVWIDTNGKVLDIPAEQIAVGPDNEHKQHSSREKHIIVNDDDETHIKIFGNDIIINERSGRNKFEISRESTNNKPVRHQRFKGHFTGFDLGFANYLNNDGNTSLPAESSFMNLNHAKSHSFAFNFMQWSIGLQRRGNIGFVTGMGIEHNRYRLSGPQLLTKNDDGITTYTTSDRNIKSNKFITTYLTVPLLLEFQIPTNKHRHELYFSAGAIGSRRLNSYTKVKYNDNEGPAKAKNHGDFNLNNWRYGMMARVGYRAINLFGTYYFSSMFENDKGPELYPVSIGFSFTFDIWDIGR